MLYFGSSVLVSAILSEGGEIRPALADFPLFCAPDMPSIYLWASSVATLGATIGPPHALIALTSPGTPRIAITRIML